MLNVAKVKPAATAASIIPSHPMDRLDALQRTCDRRAAALVMPVIFRRALDPRQTCFAMGETLSHLNYLRARGKLGREASADGIYRFARV